MTLKECHHLLQVTDNASLEEVKTAYRRRAFQLHPDLNPDRPHASRQFQLLNEAYVLLTRNLTEAPGRGKPTAGKSAGRDADRAKEETISGAKRDYDKAKSRFDWARGAKTEGQTGQPGQARPESRRANTSYQTQQDEVLRDILRDPFARRVFEDIYREIRKSGPHHATAGNKRPPETPPSPAGKKLSVGLGKRSLSIDMTHGVTGAIRNWARRQIDEEQVVYLPAETLTPGAKVRLQIRRGLSDEKKTVEFTLPLDFVVGRPVRLKGLGKNFGPWKGDLYIKLFAKI